MEDSEQPTEQTNLIKSKKRSGKKIRVEDEIVESTWTSKIQITIKQFCNIPIVILTIPLAYAFISAFENKLAGFVYGFVVLTTGILLGGIAAFLLNNFYALRGYCMKHFLSNVKSFEAFDRAITQEGAWLIFLMRITIMPYCVFSYVLGLTQVKLKQFVIGNFGEIYHILIYMFLGSTMSELDLIQEYITKEKQKNKLIFPIYISFIFLNLLDILTVDGQTASDQNGEDKTKREKTHAKIKCIPSFTNLIIIIHALIVGIEIFLAMLLTIFVSRVAKREFDKRIELDNLDQEKDSDESEGEELQEQYS